jgi:transcriptional regulator with XRE-family HTH domain
MTDLTSISQQLRTRRKALGLSLSEVARRADTSAATLSRYENGWTRFEIYTLRKLAAALGCELGIDLRPGTASRTSGANRGAVVRRLRRLFWDHPLTAGDIDEHPVWLVERVLDYGNLDDVRVLRAAMGKAAFLHTAARATRVSPRTRSLWKELLKREGIQCTRKSYRNTAWNS